MTPNESSSVSMSRRGQGRRGGDPLRTVVWVRGEHDVATRVHLAVALARTLRIDDADVVVDLSGVTFMDASTIGVLLVARSRLHDCSRSLSVRDPSPPARRVLDVCGLERLIDRVPAPTSSSEAAALGSWVDVPVLAAASRVEPEPAVEDDREPVRVTSRHRSESAVPVVQRRALP